MILNRYCKDVKNSIVIQFLRVFSIVLEIIHISNSQPDFWLQLYMSKMKQIAKQFPMPANQTTQISTNWGWFYRQSFRAIFAWHTR